MYCYKKVTPAQLDPQTAPLRLGDMAQHGYSSSRPANRFRCDEEHCSATFSRHADLQRHLDEKDPKPCTVQGCFYMWRRRARLDKHLRNNHSGFFCEHPFALVLAKY